ncbi:MAG TPA: GspH/FimT family pseudopilin [Candidatus Nitrosopolaris sp.]|nr:GspH/FimT family pseudopilin [Candidatus Nitrosopolaris sp.]
MHASRGFTLFETLVGVALATIVAAMGGLRLTEVLASTRLATAARTLATSLRLARGRALASGGSVEARFDAAGRDYELHDGTGTLEVRALPRGILFAGLPARSRIVFGALGTAENGTVTLVAGARSRSVVVNQRGRVRLQ